MNRTAGILLAVAIALTAATRIPASHAPLTQREVPSVRSVAHMAQKKASQPMPLYSGGCTAYDWADEKAPPDANRGAAKSVLDMFFQTDVHKPTDLSTLQGVRYAIALAADPRHTNLSLVFDRQMAVIQQAAQDEKYTYDSSWMPWPVDQPSLPLLADQQSQEDLTAHREACPGLLLFRRAAARAPDGHAATSLYTHALIVLVVGEQPTGGLDQDQWANAVRWIGRNASPVDQTAGVAAPRTLRVLGPSFSGTLVSLGRNLGQLYPAHPGDSSEWSPVAAKFPQARVLSGSVSDCASVRWFQQLGWPRVASLAAVAGDTATRASTPAVLFGTFAENDDRQIFSLLSYLKSQGTAANDTAILSEDETAYSGGSSADPGAEAGANSAPSGDPAASPAACAFPYAPEHRPVRLFFPRDISALRSAYEKESIFAASSVSGARAVHTILQESGEPSEDGAGNPSDTIQAYSAHLTPIAQEAVLYGIVSYMRTHHTRYVILRCTNPLDFLFLTRFFHRAYPEGRIVTVGADLLFRREIDTTEFRGVLALSNYPLLPRNQHWAMLSALAARGPGHAHRAFETPMVEGTYLAARYLFNGSEIDRPVVAPTWLELGLKESLPDYADPFWLHKPAEVITSAHAPTWLTVVGRDGYWPIAVLTDGTTPQADLDQSSDAAPHGPGPPSTMVRLTNPAAHYDLEPDGLHFAANLRSKLPLPWTLCASLSVCLLFYQLAGVVIGDRYAASGLFSPFRRVSAPSQEILLGINSAFAAMLALIPLSIGLTLPASGLFASADTEYVAFLLIGVGLMLLLGLDLARRRRWLALACYATLLTVMTGVSLGMMEAVLVGRGGVAANGTPLFYRMGHVTAGVAPLLPVLFLFSGFYLWSWNGMAGNVLLCNGRPVLPRLERVRARRGLARWYWVLLGNPVDATGRGATRLERAQIRMSQELGKRIVGMASPVSVPKAVVALPAVMMAGALVCFHADLPLLTMEGKAFALWLNLGLLLAFLLIGAEAARLFWTWIQLRRLLLKLNHLRLRRTFARLRAVEASSLWSMSGGVQRVQYLFFSQQLDAASRLAGFLTVELESLRDAVACGQRFTRLTSHRLSRDPRWDQPILLARAQAWVSLRDVFADAVAEVLNQVVYPAWILEKTSLTLEIEQAASPAEASPAPFQLPLCQEPLRTAEEFVCFQYMAFIQNILARMRTMVMSMTLLFLAVSLAIGFYPFVPRTQISIWMMVNLALIGSTVIYVYAGMERDDILSYIANTRPGRLSADFWLKSAAFLAGPVLGILTTQFPAVADSVLGWLQPGLDTIGK